MAEPVQQAVEPAERIVLGDFGELVGGDAGLAEFDQGGGPVQPPFPVGHRLVDFGVVGVGELGETGGGLAGQIQLGGSPITHGPGPVTGVDLIAVQLADQLDLAGPEPGDLRLPPATISVLPGVDLLIDGSGLTPPFHTKQYEGWV